MGAIGSIGAKIAAWLLNKATGGFLQEVIGSLTKSDGGAEKLAEINAMSSVALKKEDSRQLEALLANRLALQTTKMNQPVFWGIILLLMGPPIVMLWGVTIYNIFWWSDGLWPQEWAIAEFPPSVKPWVDKAIDWLFDPVSVPLSVGSALVAGKVIGKRVK